MQHRGLRSDLDRGWSWLVLIASFISVFVIGGLNYSTGLFHSALLETYHESQTKTAWAASLHTALCNLGGPASAFLVNRYSVRVAVLTGATFLNFGYLLTAFSPSLEVTILTFGIIAGFGQAFGCTACLIAIGFYFRRYRNIAIGLASCGTALGIFAIAPVIQIGREMYGSSGLFIIICCFTLQIFVCAVIMRPSSLECDTQRKTRALTTDKGSEKTSPVKRYLKLLMVKPIMCMSLSLLLQCWGMYIVFQYFPVLCLQKGTLTKQISFALALTGIMSVCGRLVIGLVISLRNVNEVFVYAMTIGLTGMCALTFPFYSTTYTGQLVFSCLFGFFFGGPFLTATPANIVIAGVENMAMALGIEMFFGGLGSIIGPVFAGLILDSGRTYDQIFVIAGVINLTGCCVALTAFVLVKCEPCKTSSTDDKADDDELRKAASEHLITN